MHCARHRISARFKCFPRRSMRWMPNGSTAQMPHIWQVWSVLLQEDSGAKQLHLLPIWAQTDRVWILQAGTLTVQPCTQVLACSAAPFSVVPCPDCCCLEHMNWAGSALLWYSYSSSSAAASHFIGDLPFCFQLQGPRGNSQKEPAMENNLSY